ncbi:MAG: radical SAM protein [bacterium]|nr:radical SAM protein [bacterium]
MPLYETLLPDEWAEKITFLKDNYSPCRLCPRQCRAEREKNKTGVCGAGKKVKVASYNLHHGEEPPVSGSRGSGTIFYSGCTMKCVFCQNYPISHLLNGQFYSIEQLSGLFLNLQERGAHNINFVSPTPYLYHAAAALHIARNNGLTIPIVYNTSGYERPGIINALERFVDIYMPDLKYHDNSISPKYSGVKDYFEHAYPAIGEMSKQTGELKMDEKGIARRGMILRHLLLPGQVDNSKKVLKIISQSAFKKTSLSLMSQYFPAYRAVEMPEINRRVRAEEYEEVKDYAFTLGFTDGWYQAI